jgi:hypothetical protein
MIVSVCIHMDVRAVGMLASSPCTHTTHTKKYVRGASSQCRRRTYAPAPLASCLRAGGGVADDSVLPVVVCASERALHHFIWQRQPA